MEDFQRTIRHLSVQLQGPLPGREAQVRMASLRRHREGIPFRAPGSARQASVLLLLYPVQGKTHMAFIQRVEYDGVHSGQIAFPGGEKEPPDNSSADTALREAWEETRIRPEQVEILGNLTELYIPPSNFLVTPVVGYSMQRPDFKADPEEVQHIIEIDLDLLDRKEAIQQRKITVNSEYTAVAPAYVVNENVIWGATAMILSEFLEILR